MEATTTQAGYGTMTIGGAERPFHVGIRQGDIFCRLPGRLTADGHPLSIGGYGELFSFESLKKLNLSFTEYSDFIYSALAAGCLVTKQAADFTPDDVMGWLEQADDQEASKPFLEMNRQVVARYTRQLERAKNVPAPGPATETGPTPAAPSSPGPG